VVGAATLIIVILLENNLIFFGNILGDPGKLGTETYSNIILKVVKEVNQRRFFVVNTTGAKC